MTYNDYNNYPKKFLVYKEGYFAIYKHLDGLWRDDYGTVYAISEVDLMVDKEIRCGIGIFSLPKNWGVCGPHDYAYSSTYYQLVHTRKEADKLLKKLNPGLFGKIMYRIARLFGGMFWENRKTR